MRGSAIVTGVFLAALAGEAVAADPECSGTPADPSQLYDATDGVRLCTPQTDVDGQPLEAGELTRCVILRDGSPFVTLNTTTPGSYFELAAVTTGPKRGTLSAYCEGQAGVSQPTANYDALLRRAKPGKPLLLP